ncbi:DUF2252 domain-containing protein [Deminuibacter soli]|nr:DUF2252 domain-containing protein [Deminuibacter soli]
MVQLKYEAMAQSPFRFLRGTCHLFYEDLANSSPLPLAPLTWVCGDLHMENFGSYKGDNKLVYFDLNDFDESVLAPATWEVVRMVTSIFVAFDTLNIEPVKAENMAQLYVRSYAQTLAHGKAISLDPRTADGIVCDFLTRAAKRTVRDVIRKRTVKKKKRLLLSLADERHFKLDKQLRKKLKDHINEWIKTSNEGPYNFEVIGSVFRLAGTGSIGVKRYLLLLKSTNTKSRYLFLDMKQARPSCVQPNVPVQQLQWETEAARIIAVQQRMQNVCASLLSTTTFEGESYVLQELQPVKDTIEVKLLRENYRDMYVVIDNMGMLTASAQLRSGGIQGSSIIDDLMAFGKTEGWQDAIVSYARNYASRIKDMYNEYLRAYREGAFVSA